MKKKLAMLWMWGLVVGIGLVIVIGLAYVLVEVYRTWERLWPIYLVGLAILVTIAAHHVLGKDSPFYTGTDQ